MGDSTSAEQSANSAQKSSVRIYRDLIQGTDDWLKARCGLLTASEMRLIMTPTLKVASNDKERAHLYHILAQRITQYVEPQYIGDDMLRGSFDEPHARGAYTAHTGRRIEEVGFVTNDRWGFALGYSPDGLVGDDGLVEIKSRAQKYQVQTFIEHVGSGTIPADNVLQCQAGLLISERKWIDFISYCGGLPLCIVRVYPDQEIQDAILCAATAFEARLKLARERWEQLTVGLPVMARHVEQQMFV